jgi:hypothetical protein
MYCDQCGSALVAGQVRCVRCGKEILGSAHLGRNRVKEHIRLLGILWMALSAINVVGGMVLVVIANTLFAAHGNVPPTGAAVWLRPFLTFIGALVLAKAALGFISGWGLLQHEPWGRLLSLIAAFISLFNIPLGTALGIYTFWVLLPSQSDDEYRALRQAA